MRSLEHCLNDIIKGVNDGGHHDFKNKPYYSRIEDHIGDDGGYDGLIPIGSPARSSPQSQNSDMSERFSRKVFVGGLPPDIDEGNILHFIFRIQKKTNTECYCCHCLFIVQMKSQHRFVVSGHWLLIGRIKPNRNHIFHQKDTHFSYFK